jgi:hypothetical protein
VSVDGHGNIPRVSAPKRRISAVRLGPARALTLAVPAVSPASHPIGPHAVELAGLLHELSVRLLSADSFGAALDRLAALGATALPGVARCSVALIGEGGPLSRAEHGAAGRAFDDLQYATGVGPGLEATRTRALVTVPDAAGDARWPELAEAARTDGVCAVVAIPLDVQRADVGAVSLYLDRSDALGPEMLVTAMALVGQAEVLLGELRRRDGLSAGAVVDRAVGVIIAQRGCGVQEAYDVLRDTAQRLGLDRRAVAERLISVITNRPS